MPIWYQRFSAGYCTGNQMRETRYSDESLKMISSMHKNTETVALLDDGDIRNPEFEPGKV